MDEHIAIKQAKVPVIRKVFRKGDYYTCGICRSEHSSREDANNCLNQCWYQLRTQYPLVLKKDLARGYIFRCQYCYREYKTEDAGLECAARCIEEHEKRHVYEQLTNDLPIDPRPKRKFRLVRLVPQEFISQVEIPQTKEITVEEPDLDSIKEEVSKPVAKILKRHKKEFKDSWIRDGAKYKCKYCMELYYTKLEVKGCFDGHFDESGYEREAVG